MSEVEQLKLKLKEYERRFGIGDEDPAKEGYEVLVNILRQQTEFLKEFKIKTKIASDDKSIAIEYKNAKDLWEKMPDMIKSVSILRIELKMDGVDKKEMRGSISARDIANGLDV